MTQLWELTELIRSKNASPWQLTFDIMFGSRENFDLCKATQLTDASYYAALYGLPADRVTVFLHDAALAIKVTIPRPQSAGAPSDTDVFGGQFHSPLVMLEIRMPASARQASELAGGTLDV